MPRSHKSAFVSLSILFLFMSACQDHHWEPYDKIGPLPEPTKPFQGELASGQVDLAESLKSSDYKGWSLFIVVRPVEGASMFAAAKEIVSQFPVPFTVTAENIMVGKPNPNEKFVVEAVLDKDGNIDTQDDVILSGSAKEPVEVGADNILIVITKGEK
ncbi:MAG: hypothetical protein OEZ04_00090 [Nitrospinota bacterium]|nr:hypothetical protein [Nitrospinota bacterium]